MDMFEVVIEKPAPRQEPPAPEPLALPTVLKRDDLRVNERNSLRKILRRISRRRARQLWDLALYVPGFIAFGAGPVPRELLLHHWLELMDLAVHLPGLVVLGARIRLAGFGCVARSQPIVVFKYLGQYLANSFDTSTRLRIMSHHYRTLAARLPNLGKLGFPANELALWSHRVELDTFTIGLCIPNYYYWSMEGDLSLVFSVNGVRVHRLSFTCIPGKEAGLETGTALLVGGSQGFAGTSTLVRQASKSIGEISPAAMLMLSLQALAKRLGAGTILGVTAEEQISLRAHPEQGKAPYDALWEMTGGQREGRFYRLPGGVVWKDNSHLSNSHRARARRKRELKERILSQIRENVERLFSVADRLPVILLAAFSIA